MAGQGLRGGQARYHLAPKGAVPSWMFPPPFPGSVSADSFRARVCFHPVARSGCAFSGTAKVSGPETEERAGAPRVSLLQRDDRSPAN